MNPGIAVRIPFSFFGLGISLVVFAVSLVIIVSIIQIIDIQDIIW